MNLYEFMQSKDKEQTENRKKEYYRYNLTKLVRSYFSRLFHPIEVEYEKAKTNYESRKDKIDKLQDEIKKAALKLGKNSPEFIAIKNEKQAQMQILRQELPIYERIYEEKRRIYRDQDNRLHSKQYRLEDKIDHILDSTSNYLSPEIAIHDCGLKISNRDICKLLSEKTGKRWAYRISDHIFVDTPAQTNPSDESYDLAEQVEEAIAKCLAVRRKDYQMKLKRGELDLSEAWFPKTTIDLAFVCEDRTEIPVHSRECDLEYFDEAGGDFEDEFYKLDSLDWFGEYVYSEINPNNTQERFVRYGNTKLGPDFVLPKLITECLEEFAKTIEIDPILEGAKVLEELKDEGFEFIQNKNDRNKV